MKRLLLLTLLVACSPGLGGYPCTTDDQCPTGSICGSDGKCAAGPACGVGLTLCHACVDLQSDAANCGVCGKACPGDANGTASCAAGSCALTCGSGFVKQGAGCLGPPPAPAGLTATGARGSVSLSWSASAGADHYKIERGTSRGGPYTQLDTTTATVYTDTSVASGSVYFYVVAAVNAAGDGALSNESSALTAPAAPDGIVAIPGSGQITLTWTAPATATAYAIQRSTTSGGPYAAAGTSAVSAFTDTGLLDGTAYFYLVIASNASGTSLPSAEAKATTRTATTGPGNLRAQGTLTSISLQWDPVANASAYNVYRSATNQSGSFQRVGGGSSASFTDVTGVLGSSDYYYQVAAVVGGLEGGASTIAIPSAPLALGSTGSPTLVSLHWTGSAVATSYTINRGDNSGSYDTNFASSDPHFDDVSVGNQPYFYQVLATAQAAVRNSIELAVPAAPTALFASLPSPGSVPLSWTAASPAPSGYHLLRSSGGAFAQVDSGAPLTVTSFTDTDAAVTSAATWQYEAASVIGSASRASLPATLYAAPAWAASTGDATSVSLAFGSVAGAGGYRLERAGAAAGPFTQIGSPSSSPAPDSGLTAGSEYWYRLRSFDSASGSYGLASATLHFPAQPDPPTLAGGMGNVQVSWTGGAGATQFDVVRESGRFGHVISPYTDNDAALSNTLTYHYDVEAKDGPAARASDATLLLPAPVFSATTSPATEIDLAWSNTGSAGYVPARADSAGGPFTPLFGGGKIPVDNSATDTSVGANPYFYVVQSWDSGSVSMYSDVLAVPGAPTLMAAGDPSSITVSWTGSGVESSWLGERGSSSGNYDVSIPLSAPGATDSSVSSSAYFYRVSAMGPLATRQGAELAVPSARTVTQTGGDPSSVSLSWAAGSEGTPVPPDSMKILRQALGDNTVAVTTLAGGATSGADTSLVGPTPYQIIVQAYTASAQRNSATLLLPEAPVLTQANGWGTQVDLAWTGSAHAVGYGIFRSGSLFDEVGAGATTDTDTNAVPAQSWTYNVLASADLGRASAPLAIPAPPSGLTATPAATSVSLSWSPASDATGWRVIRSSTPGGEDPGSPLATVSTPSYTDSGLAVGATWYYVVQATATGTQSIQSSEASATTFIAAPTGLIGSQSNHNVAISWTPSAGATSYVVSRASALPGPYSQVGTPSSPAFTETLTNAIATVYYQVVATDGTNPSAPSAALTVNPRQFCVVDSGSGSGGNHSSFIESYDETQTSGSPLAAGTVSGESSGCQGCIRSLASDVATHSLFYFTANGNRLYLLNLPLSCSSGVCIPGTSLGLSGGPSGVSAAGGEVFVPFNSPSKVAWSSETLAAVSQLTLTSVPLDVQFDAAAGEVYVLTSSQVQVYDFTTLLSKRSGNLPGGGANTPAALAIGAGSFYVGTGQGSITEYSSSWTGTTLTQLAATATSLGSNLHGLSLDALGGVLRAATVNCSNNFIYTLPLDLSSSTRFAGSWPSSNCNGGPSAVTLCN